MADAGLRDIFIAYPLVGAEKLRRACALAQRVDRLILAVDSIAQGTPLAEAGQAHDVVLEVRIEVDCGGGRTGAEMADFAPLVQFVESCPNLKLTGLYTFRGLNGGIDDRRWPVRARASCWRSTARRRRRSAGASWRSAAARRPRANMWRSRGRRMKFARARMCSATI